MKIGVPKRPAWSVMCTLNDETDAAHITIMRDAIRYCCHLSDNIQHCLIFFFSLLLVF